VCLLQTTSLFFGIGVSPSSTFLQNLFFAKFTASRIQACDCAANLDLVLPVHGVWSYQCFRRIDGRAIHVGVRRNFHTL
jgi:hypothetical protein